MFRIQQVLGADELLDVAFRKASKVNAKGSVARAKVGAAGSLIAHRLNKYVHSFPSIDRLHPFHKELVDALVGSDQLKQSLGALTWCAERVGKVAKEFRGSDVKAPYGRISSLVKQVRKDLAFLDEARGKLDAIPSIDPAQPTIIIAGPPNVGKSSLVVKLSTARPKIASYPFTTKELHVGHAEHRGIKVQIIDTPGLLDRPMAERNAIERQAVLALRHLDAAVAFLLDPSETCGYDLEYQERVLAELGSMFPEGRLIVIESKADLRTTGKRDGVSATTGKGVDEVWSRLVSMLKLDSSERLF